MIRTRTNSYTINLLLHLSQTISTLAGYNADCTTSAALGEIMWTKYQGQPIPWHRPLQAWLQRTLDSIEHNHCLKASRNALNNRHLTIPSKLARKIGGQL